MKRRELLQRAGAWTQGRRDRSRPLSAAEREKIEQALLCLVAELPTELVQYKAVAHALAELDLQSSLRVKLAPGASEPGALSLLSMELFAKDDAAISVILVKIASTLAVYQMVAKLLMLPMAAMDFFAEGYVEHGNLLGRGTLLSGWMLMKINAHLFIEMAGLSAHPEVKLPTGKVALSGTDDLFVLTAFQQRGPAEHRAKIYGRTTRTEPRSNFRISTKTYSEETVWDLVFGTIGTRHYRLEVPKSADRRSRPSVRRARTTGNAYLQ